MARLIKDPSIEILLEKIFPKPIYIYIYISVNKSMECVITNINSTHMHYLKNGDLCC